MSNNNNGAPAQAHDSLCDRIGGWVILCLLLGGTITAIVFAVDPRLFNVHPHIPPQVQLTSASVSSTSNNTSSSSLLNDAVWDLTLQFAFPHATVVHYNSFRASVLFDSGGGRGQLEMAAAKLPAPFEEKGGHSTFNLRLESGMAVQESILSDMVAAGSVDFGVRVEASVRVDMGKKGTEVASVRADCNPVRIWFPEPHATAAGGLAGSLPISITCDVH